MYCAHQMKTRAGRPYHVMAAILIFCGTVFSQSTKTANLEHRLDAVRGQIPSLKERIEKLKSAGQDVSYPMVPFTVIENFVGYTAEDLKAFMPDGWGWLAVNGNESSYEPDTTVQHSGRVSAKIVNKTGQKPNVYGMLSAAGAITIQEGQPYTFSVWVK